MPLNHLRPLNEPRTYVTLFLGHYYNHGYFNQRHISQANPPLTKNQEYTLLLQDLTAGPCLALRCLITDMVCHKYRNYLDIPSLSLSLARSISTSDKLIVSGPKTSQLGDLSCQATGTDYQGEKFNQSEKDNTSDSAEVNLWKQPVGQSRLEVKHFFWAFFRVQESKTPDIFVVHQVWRRKIQSQICIDFQTI